MSRGRPTSYTEALGKAIAEDIGRGMTQKRAAQKAGVHPDTVGAWKAVNEDFRRLIDRSKALFGERVDNGIHEIAFDSAHTKRLEALCRIKDTLFADESPRVKKLVAEALETQEIIIARAIASLDPETQRMITGALKDAREVTLTGESHRAAKSGSKPDERTPSH